MIYKELITSTSYTETNANLFIKDVLFDLNNVHDKILLCRKLFGLYSNESIIFDCKSW